MTDLILWKPNLGNKIMFLATGMSINTLDCKMYMPNRIIDLVYLKQISPSQLPMPHIRCFVLIFDPQITEKEERILSY